MRFHLLSGGEWECVCVREKGERQNGMIGVVVGDVSGAGAAVVAA